MKWIDRETRQRILDAADIVEVVSDYVSLKRRGANYLGLCPFHNERTPSFAVSPTRGICKCFSCGKGGSAVGFIMEIEHLTFHEALLHLARKYHIEVKEREMTEQEKEEESRRQSLMAVNEYAMEYFEHTLHDTPDGENIGLAYFRERGLSDEIIRRFRLGYSLDSFDALTNDAVKKGYNADNLVTVGLSGKRDNGSYYDKYRGRVIFPIFTVSGRPIAFGGRRLSDNKEIAKYVNSPESEIYSKRRELYGLYHARNAIHKKDECILVEGYMDVISMHQSGVENVVASSGTSLTIEQVSLIRRMTKNVVVIYDSDPAGIKASLRGIDLLLAQGLNVKIVQFPPGEDPDSYARTHTSEELEQWIAEHRTDFMTFKTSILMESVASNDPVGRANVINDIINTIAVIPDDVIRSVYVETVARQMAVNEDVVRQQVRRRRFEAMEKDRKEKQRREGHDDLEERLAEQEAREQSAREQAMQPSALTETRNSRIQMLRPFEWEVVKYVVRYGMMKICDLVDEKQKTVGEMTVMQFIRDDLQADEVIITNDDIRQTYEAALALDDDEWVELRRKGFESIDQALEEMRRSGQNEIAENAQDSMQIGLLEKKLEQQIEEQSSVRRLDFLCERVANELVNHSLDVIRRTATDMLTEKYQLSKIHTKYVHVADERERCRELVERALFELKDAILGCDLEDQKRELKRLTQEKASNEKILDQMQLIAHTQELKQQFAPWIGDRVIQRHHRKK